MQRTTGIVLCTVVLLTAVLTGVAVCQKPDDVYPKNQKTEPAKISTDIYAIPEQVVQYQWPTTLDLVNAPVDLKQLEPGQCVRFGVIATGDRRDELLRGSKFSFDIRVADKTQKFPPEPLLAMKRIKPEGGDFVTEALSAAGIQNPMSSLASLAASQAHWCAPFDVRDGTLTVEGMVTSANGKHVRFTTKTIEVKTLETARSKPPFKDINELGSWIQSYYRAPDPAQLLPALRIAAADEKLRTMQNFAAFLVAALKGSPAAAEDLSRHLASENRTVQAYAIPLLAQAGYPVESLLTSFSDAEKAQILSNRLPDPYDMTPNRSLPNRMDMIWSTFFATGRIEPVRAISSMLAWRDDYDSFMKLRASGQRPTALTDSIMRGVVYTAAGWSLNAISRNNGLVNDYIEFLEASPVTLPTVKKELASIHTNPAFTRK